jgi:hypothetical protein
METAAYEAWVSLSVYRKAREYPSLRILIAGKPDVGTHVALFPRSIATAAAYMAKSLVIPKYLHSSLEGNHQ